MEGRLTMDTTTRRPVVNAHAVIPAWDDLTPDQRFRYAGNLDPWAGPVDPIAQARWEERHRTEASSWPVVREQEADSCGCWQADCAECMKKRSNGLRPAPGVVRRYGLAR
jgi:hypothetical protein